MSRRPAPANAGSVVSLFPFLAVLLCTIGALLLLLVISETTQQALDNMDAIMGVKGLDGVYVGPSDLGISLGFPPGFDPVERTIAAAREAASRVRGLRRFVADSLDRQADGILVCDTDGRIALANRRCAQLIGTPQDVELGRGAGGIPGRRRSFPSSPP